MTITGNSGGQIGSGGEGGGIAATFSSSPILTNVTISGNSAESTGGGIIIHDDSDPTLNNVTISDNTAGYGGGIAIGSNSSPSLTNVMISGNSAMNGVGGLHCFSGSASPSLANVTITENSASSVGGFSCSTAIFDSNNRSSIYLNHAAFYSDVGSLGHIIVDTFTVMSPTIYHAPNGTTFDILNAIQTLVNADLYVSPTGDDTNDGLSSNSPLKTIAAALSKIQADSSNPRTIYLAPGVYSPNTNGETFPLTGLSHVSIKGSGEHNTILDANGESQGLHFRDVEGVQVEGLTIRNGVATGDMGGMGGGIYCYGPELNLVNMTITGNSALDHHGMAGSGGGIWTYCPLNLENVTISDNTAGTGGALYTGSTVNITNALISDNTATTLGGGGIGGGGNLTLLNVTMTGNSAHGNGGGVILNDGGGINLHHATVELVNSIVWNNTPEEIFLYGSSYYGSSVITSTYSDIQGGQAGIIIEDLATVNWLDGNLDADPLFVDAANGNFRLSNNSPVIDVGTSANAPDYDIEGMARPQGAGWDLGAYEYPSGTSFSLTPNSAVANAGNLPVIISGSGLQEPVTARIGSVDLLDVTLENANTLHAVVPVGSLSEGTYDLTVESAGQPVTLTDAFTVEPAVAPTQFLAMVYLACDNNLASSCRRLFNNLELAMTNNPNLRIAVYWDGKAHGDSAYYLVQADDNPYAWASYDESQRVSLGEMDSAYPGTLVQFVSWAQSQYPGEYNFLSLVDHGSGWAPDLYPAQMGYQWTGGVGGMFWDDTSQNVMSTQALAGALDWISDGNALDALYLDACQMGTVEVVAELAPYAQYVIAHENLAWATYPYDQYFNGMDGSTTPSALAQQIAQVNRDSWPNQGHPSHIAVVNSSQMDNALSKLDTLASQLLSALPDNQVRLAIDEVVRNSAHIDENTDFRINGEDSAIDLYHFASELEAHADIPAGVKNAAQALMNALDSTIEANYTHSDTPWPGTEAWDLSNLHGLSVYFPLADEWKRAFYGPEDLPRFASSTAWDDFIQAWYGGTQQQRAAAPEPPTEPCPECLIPPMHTALTIGQPESAIVGEPVWVPVWLSGVETEDDLRGVQLSVQVTDTNMLAPADDLQPRLGEFFPEDSYTYAVHSSNGKGWDYILTDVGDFESQAVSGEGIMVELPFYAQAEGCVYVEFKTHLLGNHQAEEVNHHQAGNWVCTNDRGTLTGRAFLQSRNPGAYDQVSVTITGPRETYTTTTDVDGNYTFLNIYQDEYEMTFTHIASVPLFAQREVSNVSVNAGGTTTLDVGLWAGDIDQDGYVDRDDEKLLEAATIPVDFPSFDINANGETNVFDLIILQHNKARPNLSSTNPPQGRAGTVAGRAADANSVPREIITSQEAREFRLRANANAEVAYTLRAEVLTGTIESIGTRLALPAGASVTSVELSPAFTGGQLFWEQEADKLFIVAAPDLVLTEDADVLTIRMNTTEAETIVTVEAVNKVGWDGELVVPGATEVQDETNVLYLPMMTR